MSESVQPVIDSTWIIAMILVGWLGVFIHFYFLWKSFRVYFNLKVKNRLFIAFCILLLLFNTMACLMWAIFRINFIFDLTVKSCQIIYVFNWLFYFIGKYILHCLLIFRIYLTFRRSNFSISRRKTIIFVIIVSINAFLAMFIWAVSVAPNILVGKWVITGTQHEICTLFSDQVNNHLMIKLSAITIGIEDFIVGGVTLCVFVGRFRVIAKEADDKYLLETAIRFGICAFLSVISTFFLFTLAIPFYPNFTFILGIDAIINSLCLYCVTGVGEHLYKIICMPCSVYGEKWVKLNQTNPSASSSELVGKMFRRSVDVQDPPNFNRTFSSINTAGIEVKIGAAPAPAPAPKKKSVSFSGKLPVLPAVSKSVNTIYQANKDLATHLTKLPSLHPSKSDPVRTNGKH